MRVIINRSILFFFISLLISINAFPQCPDYLSCGSQEDIDNFPLEYPNCTWLEQSLYIGGGGITNLDGLSALTFVGSNVTIEVTSLTDLSGLDNLTTIGGSLSITNNPHLTSLSGLENLAHVGLVLGIDYNDSLTTLSGLGSLVSVNENISIINNGSLSSLAGMESLAEARNGFSIIGNPNLTSLADFENLTYVAEYLWIDNNESLNSLAGFIALDSLDGSLTISNYKGLTSLGLVHLKSINGSLELSQNYFVKDIHDFGNLSSIQGDLIINKCNAVTNLRGLNNLVSIGGSLEISENNALSSLVGIDSIDAGSISNLNITFNPMLSECEVKSVCDYLFDPSGDIEIHSNYNGCNNYIEIENACTASVNEITQECPISLFPNPASNELYITMEPDEEIAMIRIYNQLGRQIRSSEVIHNPIDISALPPGLYLVEVDYRGSSIKERLVVSR
jgi:hypothetical protein